MSLIRKIVSERPVSLSEIRPLIQPACEAAADAPAEAEENESGVIAFALREFKQGGLNVEDPQEYEDHVAVHVLQLLELFSREGHSGFSASLAIHWFKNLASYKPITPLLNPMETGLYHDISDFNPQDGKCTLQSTHVSSLFSEDGGKTWYDIDRKPKGIQYLYCQLYRHFLCNITTGKVRDWLHSFTRVYVKFPKPKAEISDVTRDSL